MFYILGTVYMNENGGYKKTCSCKSNQPACFFNAQTFSESLLYWLISHCSYFCFWLCNIGHGAGHRRPRCKLDAITTDSTGKSYAFIGEYTFLQQFCWQLWSENTSDFIRKTNWKINLTTISGIMYIRLDTHRDGIHPFPIARSWKEVSGSVDAVFSYGDRIYIIQVKENTAFNFK